MPVKWNVLAVSQALDGLEELLKEAEPTLLECGAKALEASKMPGLAGYVSEPLEYLSDDIARLLERHRSRIARIREKLPNGDLAKQQGKYDKWLNHFGGDEAKAQMAMSLF